MTRISWRVSWLPSGACRDLWVQPQRRCRWSPWKGSRHGLEAHASGTGGRPPGEPEALAPRERPEHLCTWPDGSACAPGRHGAPVDLRADRVFAPGPHDGPPREGEVGVLAPRPPLATANREAEALAPRRKRIARDRRAGGLPLGKRSSDRGTRACPRETVPSGTEAEALAPKLTWTEALAPRPTWNGAYATRIRPELSLRRWNRTARLRNGRPRVLAPEAARTAAPRTIPGACVESRPHGCTPARVHPTVLAPAEPPKRTVMDTSWPRAGLRGRNGPTATNGLRVLAPGSPPERFDATGGLRTPTRTKRTRSRTRSPRAPRSEPRSGHSAHPGLRPGRADLEQSSAGTLAVP